MAIPERQSAQAENNPKHTGLIAMPSPATELDLLSEIQQLHKEEAWQKGTASKVLARYSDLRISLVAIKGDTSIGEHQNAGRVSIQTVTGHLRMHALGKVFDLPMGHVVVLDRAVKHSVDAMRDSAFLLTVTLPEQEENPLKSDAVSGL